VGSNITRIQILLWIWFQYIGTKNPLVYDLVYPKSESTKRFVGIWTGSRRQLNVFFLGPTELLLFTLTLCNILNQSMIYGEIEKVKKKKKLYLNNNKNVSKWGNKIR